jgi:hypothetical protein
MNLKPPKGGFFFGVIIFHYETDPQDTACSNDTDLLFVG